MSAKTPDDGQTFIMYTYVYVIFHGIMKRTAFSTVVKPSVFFLSQCDQPVRRPCSAQTTNDTSSLLSYFLSLQQQHNSQSLCRGCGVIHLCALPVDQTVCLKKGVLLVVIHSIRQ